MRAALRVLCVFLLTAAAAACDCAASHQLPDARLDAAPSPDGAAPGDAEVPTACGAGERIDLGPGSVVSGAFGDGHFGVILAGAASGPSVVFADPAGGPVVRHSFSSSPELAAELRMTLCPGPGLRLGWLGDRWMLVSANQTAHLSTVGGFAAVSRWSPTQAGGVLSFLDAAISPSGVGLMAFDGLWPEGEDHFCAQGGLVFLSGTTEGAPTAERVPLGQPLSPPSAAVTTSTDGYATATYHWDEVARVATIRITHFSEAGVVDGAFDAPSGNVPPPGGDGGDQWWPREIQMDGQTIGWANQFRGFGRPHEIALHVGRLGDGGIAESEFTRVIGPDDGRTPALRFSVLEDGPSDLAAWIDDGKVRLRRFAGGALGGVRAVVTDGPVDSLQLLRASDGTIALAWSAAGMSYLQTIDCAP